METRSPLEGIFNMIGALPQGHDKPIEHALYNAVAIFLLFICCAAGWALYVILEPFIKPLMWALLVGSVLHPLKRSLSETFLQWLTSLEEANTPVVIGVLLLPVNILNTLSIFLGDNLFKYKKIIIGVVVSAVLLHFFYFYTPSIVLNILWQFFVLLSWLIHLALDLSSFKLVGLCIAFYISFVYLTWNPQNSHKFHIYSLFIWFAICLAIANSFSSFGLPVFMLIQTILLMGLLFELYHVYEKRKEEGNNISFSGLMSLTLQGDEILPETDSSENECTEKDTSIESNIIKPKRKSSVKFADQKNDKCDEIENSNIVEDLVTLDTLQKPKTTKSDSANTELITNKEMHLLQPKSQEIFKFTPIKPHRKFQRSLSQPHFCLYPKQSNILKFGMNLYRRASIQNLTDEESHSSTFYLYSVIWACVIMLFWKNVMLLPILALPIFYYILKHLGLYLGIWQCLYAHGVIILNLIFYWCQERQNALVPIPIRGLYKIIDSLNTAIKNFIRNSIDTVSSIVVIFGLIIFLTCGSLFFIVQIYAEGIMLVQITSNVINQTIVHNPELRQLLPPTFDDTVDSLLDNAYLYGREGISKAVKSLMTDVDAVKSEKIEKQILEIWDRFYQSWMTSDSQNGPRVTQEAVQSSWDAFISDIKKSPEMFNFKGLMDFGKQNIGMLMSLLDSIWGIVKGNINLALGSLGTFLSVILGGGTAVMNFILNVVVFLTTLFYLLNSSGELYKPVEIMTKFSASSSRFGHALEGAINGVFTASVKMATFYGLWTWFIHNLFGVQIVYLPSAFATILGAVPFLGTYWAGVPAVLDLWLAQDRGIAAIIFATFQFLPTYVVDTTIYKEIKGGHPYLTGLAIAGGIFCLGVEGAIIGPILLCGFYVAMDLSSSLFQASPSEESLNLRLR